MRHWHKGRKQTKARLFPSLTYAENKLGAAPPASAHSGDLRILVEHWGILLSSQIKLISADDG